MIPRQHEILRELVNNLRVNTEDDLNRMFEVYPTLTQTVLEALGTTRSELMLFLRDGYRIYPNVVADSVLGVNSISLASVRFDLSVFRLRGVL